jgi:hypothetical protein
MTNRKLRTLVIPRPARTLLAASAALTAAFAAVACSDDDAATDTSATVRPDSGAHPADGGAHDATVLLPGDDGGGEVGDATADATGDAAVTDASDAGHPDSSTGPVPVILPIAPGRHARLFNVVYTATGNIYAVGQAGDATDPEDLTTLLVKILPTGALDPAFGANGVVRKNVAVGKAGESARGLVVQSSGKIVVAGTVEHGAATEVTRDLTVLRFEPSGALDTTFGNGGVVRLPLGATGELVAQWGLSQYASGDLLVVGAL